MHAIIELLLVIFGIIIAQMFQFTKAFHFRSILPIFLNVIGGAIVNWLSKEGIELLIVDVTLTCLSCYSFIFLNSYFIKKAQ